MNTDKYDRKLKSESPLDYLIYYPLSELLLDPIHCLGLTPNMVTYLSIVLNLLSAYLIVKDKLILSMILCNLAYLCDSIDGKLARKFNMSSDFGMKLDIVSDNICYIILICVIFVKNKFDIKLILIILFIYYMNSKWHGLNEALNCYNKNGHDNFYKINYDKFKDDESILNKLFLFTLKTSYTSYKQDFPNFNKKCIEKKLGFYRFFGAGSIPLFSNLLTLY